MYALQQQEAYFPNFELQLNIFQKVYINIIDDVLAHEK